MDYRAHHHERDTAGYERQRIMNGELIMQICSVAFIVFVLLVLAAGSAK